jgi:hypothetical protein
LPQDRQYEIREEINLYKATKIPKPIADSAPAIAIIYIAYKKINYNR